MTEFHDDENFVLLTDEDGVEHEFEVLDVLNIEEQDYAILAMPDSDEDAIVLRIEEGADGNHVLVDIEDEEEWNMVAQAWEEIQDDESEWVEEEDDEGEKAEQDPGK